MLLRFFSWSICWCLTSQVALAAISPPSSAIPAIPAAPVISPLRAALQGIHSRLDSGVLYGTTSQAEACTANVLLSPDSRNLQITLFRGQDLQDSQTQSIPARSLYEFSLSTDTQIFSVQKFNQDKYYLFAHADKRTLSGIVGRILEVRYSLEGALNSIKIADANDPAKKIICEFGK